MNSIDMEANLNLIYGKVVNLGNNVYAIADKEHQGFVDNNSEEPKVVEPIYDGGLFGNNYIGLWNTVARYKKSGILYLINTGKTLTFLDNELMSGIAEHNAIGNRIITIPFEDDKIQIIDTDLGDVIDTSLGKISYRPGDTNFIMTYYREKQVELIGITRDFQVCKVLDYLNGRYTGVKVAKSKIEYTDDNGNTIKLNKFGQVY